jgi:hypothetical protein
MLAAAADDEFGQCVDTGVTGCGRRTHVPAVPVCLVLSRRQGRVRATPSRVIRIAVCGVAVAAIVQQRGQFTAEAVAVQARLSSEDGLNESIRAVDLALRG